MIRVHRRPGLPVHLLSLLVVLAGLAAPLAAQEAAAPAPPARSGEEGFLPRLDVYFPEGDLDLRVSRLVNKVFFEGQVKYNFVNGDIAAFLRYRYYGYNRTTQLTVFDEVEFQDIQEFSNDFDRVRGTLVLVEWPQSYQRRAFLLAELDRISTNKEELAEILRRGETNTFVRLGYQIGTPRAPMPSSARPAPAPSGCSPPSARSVPAAPASPVR